MLVSVMREADCVQVAALIERALMNLGEDEQAPCMAYILLPEQTPAYSYRYYNIRSRHLRLVELFFLAHSDDYSRIEGVLSVQGIRNRRCYLRLIALDQTLMAGEGGRDTAWFLREAMRELRRYVDMDAVRLLTIGQDPSDEAPRPYMLPRLQEIIRQCEFRLCARLENELGRNTHIEFYECQISEDATAG